jgi:hypothetical protein
VAEADENETPFAHVPAPEAGPIPSQVGPFTWDKVAASTGMSGYGGGRMSRWMLALLVLLGVAFVALIVLTVTGALP